MTTDRWRDGKLGLVHQLAPVETKIRVSEAPYFGGSISSYYGPAKDRVVTTWEPLCGVRRKKNKRQGRHNGPVTCLLCIGRL
jgi:hypothetical protein